MPMKVIVCFDNVRVTVPCGEGTILVRELISKAVHRYKRATGKGSNYLVEVTSLKTISGGGILDPDDQLNDVVDDREQLIAEYEEQDRPSIQHNGGDGASASSTGTTSPDIFQTGEGTPLHDQHNPPSISALLTSRQNSTSSNNAITDVVVVTPRDLSLGSNLRVRRGSEPNLNLLLNESGSGKSQLSMGSVKPAIPRRESVRDSDEPRSESSDDDRKMKVTMHGSLDRKRLGQTRFARDALRTSLSNRPEMFRWLEAQEKAELRNSQIQAQERTGPVEGHDGKDETDSVPSSDSCLVCLHNDGGPLGIHAVPACDNSGKDMGLLIQSIEPDRPVHKDGRIQPNDIITEINGTSLQDVPFLRAQDIFRAAMDTNEIRLKVVKGNNSNTSSPTFLQPKRTPAPQPPPVLPKPRTHAPMKPSPLTLPPSEAKMASPTPAPRDINKKITSLLDTINGNNKSSSANPITNSSYSAASSSVPPSKTETLSSAKRAPAGPPTANVIKPGPPIKAPKKVPPALPARSPTTSLSSLVADAPLNAITNTRRIGKKLSILLKKGPLGLGFSVTSRDNQTDGNCPIYIRNILPKGAAVQDGQLRPGDRLLEVNGVEMTGKTQAEAVAFLRMLPEGSQVELVVSRQEEVDEKFKVPRKLGDASTSSNEKRSNDDGDVDDDDVNDVDVDDVSVEQPAVSTSQPSHSVDELDSAVLGPTKEKLTLHIPLNETGSAGLGVSVKGKTLTSEAGVEDLGIFVKTVLQGGAASKDGRLQVNDQLLEVNGVRLEGMSNTSAMEALRIAMMEDGQIPGLITLTVARRAGSTSSPFLHGDSPDSSQLDIMPSSVHQRSSSVDVIHQRTSSASNPPSPSRPSFGSETMPSPIPPVRSKRVAALREHFSDSGGGLRNESYAKATHESFNDSSAFTNIMPSPPRQNQPQKEPSPQEGSENNVVVQNDTYTLPHKPQRPHSTIGFMHGPRTSHSSASDDDAFLRASVASSKDGSDLSPNGDLLLPFAREGFGRQSMSEKRKGHLDPRSTEIYKLVKANKENRGGFLGRRVRSFHVTGGTTITAPPAVPPKAPTQPVVSGAQTHSSHLPPNSMVHVTSGSTYQPTRVASDMSALSSKRASSFEDLAGGGINFPAVGSSSTIQTQPPRDASPVWRPSRFGRARGCNDSFRAAVDRSYDALDPALMDTLEEESAESGAFTLEPSHSGRSSISSEANTEDTNSLKRRKAKEKEKKGLFKGFLRFGKGRKSNEDAMRRSRSEERSEERLVDRRADYSAERPSKDRWTGQLYGDMQRKEYTDQNQSGRGRRAAAYQDSSRIEEEYARLRDHHVAEQRLRSQSVDPTVGRNLSNSSYDGTSPFQPYPLAQQQPGREQQHFYHQPMDRPDPRNFHPAAMAQGSQFTGSKQSFSSMESEPDGKGNLAKAMMTRAEYIQQLRSLYQKRHRQRQGVYPLDDKEEQYEKQIKEMEGRWDSHVEFEGSSRDPNLLQFTDRPPSRQKEQKRLDLKSASYSSTNSNNSSHPLPASHQQHPYQQHQHSQYDTDRPYQGNRPHSRGGPTNYDNNTTYNHQPQSNLYNQYQQHWQQHHLPQRADEEVKSAHYRERYMSSDSNSGRQAYPSVYDTRPHNQFYTNATHAYRNPANQYTHHGGNAPYSDPSSAKV